LQQQKQFVMQEIGLLILLSAKTPTRLCCATWTEMMGKINPRRNLNHLRNMRNFTMVRKKTWIILEEIKQSKNRRYQPESTQNYIRPVRLAYKPYFFSQRTVFFSHNKAVNSTFSHGLSAKRTGHLKKHERYPN